MKPAPTEGQQAYTDLVERLASALGADEFWCVTAPNGEIVAGTIDKRIDEPIIRFCDEYECDWDDAKDEGFALGRCTLPSQKDGT